MSSDVIRGKRRKIRLAKKNGVLMAPMLFDVAAIAEIPYWAACAFAMQETAGGKNIYGHDGGPGHPFYGHGQVTECNYRTYKKEAVRTGKRQGVGPLQLTSKGFQDAADKLGGCWQPRYNAETAFKWMRGRRIEGKDWPTIARLYNGSQAYADEMTDRFEFFRRLFKDEKGDDR